MVMTQSETPAYSRAVLQVLETGQQVTMWLHMHIYWGLLMRSSVDSCKLCCTVSHMC